MFNHLKDRYWFVPFQNLRIEIFVDQLESNYYDNNVILSKEFKRVQNMDSH